MGMWMAWLGLGWAILFSIPAGVHGLCKPLQDVPPPTDAVARRAQAVVILGAGRNLDAPEYGGVTVSRMSLERVRFGAQLAKRYGLPVLVTGGPPSRKGPSEAALMREVPDQEFGVPVQWVEADSLDTRDQGRMVTAMLREAGLSRALLVTHALHMRRALGEFSAGGLDLIAAPTGRYDGSGSGPWITRWLPNAEAAHFAWFASHEWLGALAQRFRP